LGEVAQIKGRRSLYRLDHLSRNEFKILWHQRGLVHILMYNLTLKTKWHLNPSFLNINAWNMQGYNAQNLDEWTYSRPLEGVLKVFGKL
jgi:hypothetical protein